MTFQIGTPLLDGCVLAILSREDAYGYSLTQRVKEVIDISESTLYPVLRRLQKEGCLTVYDREIQGRNRRYYALTEAGRLLLRECQAAWRDHRKRVERLLLEQEEALGA